MKNITEKLISILLVLAIVISTGSILTVNAKDDETIATVSTFEQAENLLAKDEVYPTIIIHGIGQADTVLLDDSGNPVLNEDGEAVTGWPVSIDANVLIKGLLVPLILSLFFQRDIGLTKATYNTAAELLGDRAYNDDGTPKNNYKVIGYDNKCVAECSEEQKNQIYENVPLRDYTSKVGEENLYYFAYNSFGDVYTIIDDLEVLIEKAKKETGKDKVNIVPISLGGAISVAYFDEHKDGADINKVVFIVPALDGSEIVGKVMLGQLDFSDEGIYRTMFTRLVGEDDYTGWLINVGIRLLPKKLFIDMFKAVAEGFTAGTLSKVTTMWGLVPSSMYDELAAKYLTPGTVLKEKADRFHQAQLNLRDNLKNYEKKGIKIYDICGYGVPLYSLVASDSNSDKIIHSSSTSIGATFSKVGETLGKDYIQQNYKEYNLISPDGQVDASTAAFPFTTWFFSNQDHEDIGDNDVVVRLASEILVAKEMDIFTTSAYPQFNGHRDTRDLKDRINDAKRVDKSVLDEATATRLSNALAAAEENLNKTVIVEGETEAVQAELEAALVQANARAEEDNTKDKALLFFSKGISEALYYFFGAKGFFE